MSLRQILTRFLGVTLVTAAVTLFFAGNGNAQQRTMMMMQMLNSGLQNMDRDNSSEDEDVSSSSYSNSAPNYNQAPCVLAQERWMTCARSGSAVEAAARCGQPPMCDANGNITR